LLSVKGRHGGSFGEQISSLFLGGGRVGGKILRESQHLLDCRATLLLRAREREEARVERGAQLSYRSTRPVLLLDERSSRFEEQEVAFVRARLVLLGAEEARGVLERGLGLLVALAVEKEDPNVLECSGGELARGGRGAQLALQELERRDKLGRLLATSTARDRVCCAEQLLNCSVGFLDALGVALDARHTFLGGRSLGHAAF
jgi:hypothetical protein